MISIAGLSYVWYHVWMNIEQTLGDEQVRELLSRGIAYDAPATLSRLMDKLGFSMKKRFGQNFMVSPHARAQIITLAGPVKDRVVWEIGPGFGALTNLLLGKAALVRAFEIDFGFIRVLRILFGDRPDFVLVEGDALRTWKPAWDEDAAQGGPAAIIGNLPYNVGSAIIADILEAGCIAPRMVFTVQKEVAERMASIPGNPDYSSFSIHCQARCRVSIEASLKPTCFWPQPEVNSAVVVLEPRKVSLPITNQELFGVLVRSSFAARRKTLENNCKSSSLAATVGMDRMTAGAESAGISLKARGETLSAEDFARWANAISATA